MKNYTVTEAAKELGRTPRCLYRWIKDGFILATKDGETWQITEAEITRAKAENPVLCPKNTIIGRKNKDNKTR